MAAAAIHRRSAARITIPMIDPSRASSLFRVRLPSRDELRRLLSLAAPITLVQVALMAIGVEDCMIVGRFSAAALAGVAIGSVYFFTLSSFGFGMLLGLEPLLSQAAGARDSEGMTRVFQRGLVLVVVLGTLIALAVLPSAQVLRHMGQPAVITDIASRYLRVQAPSTYMLLLFSLMRTTLQIHGSTRPIVATIVAANLLNIVLSIALVFGHWGLPRMGPVGSGIAALIARTFMAGGLLALAWGPLQPHFVWRRDSMARGPLWQVVRIGLPVGVQMLLEFGVFAVVGLVMGHLGPTAAAAHQIAINIASLTYMVPLGVGTAGSVLVGRSIGAGDPGAARRFAVAALAVGSGFMACSALILMAAPTWIARAYTDDGATVALAASLIPIAGVFQVFDGTQVVSIGLLRGSGDTRAPMIVNLVGYWVVGLPLSLWLARGLHLGPRGLWWGLVAGLAAVALIVLIRLRARMRGTLQRITTDNV
jgi:MATE family multidrug resistance protein